MTEQRLKDLLEQMTLEEKLGEMTQLSPEFLGVDENTELTGPMKELRLKENWISSIGSTLNLFGARAVRELQEKHLKESRLKIPLMFMADIIHGYKTVFPIPLAMGCTFSPELYQRISRIAAKESAASGIHITFAPMSDLVRDPRWGRVMESTGEDPYLNAKMAEAAVRGYQGENLKETDCLGACIKHIAAYGAPEGGREYHTVDISEGILREFYFPAYKAAIKAGAVLAMTSFNFVDRVPASANSHIFREILRDEWGFEGVTISDYNAVDEIMIHGAAENGYEATKKSMQAGIDIEMMSTHYLNEGKVLIDEEKVSMKLLDEAVMRILKLKNALGLFENPYKGLDEEKEKELHLCEQHRKVSYEAAMASLVLLKNEHVLPLTGKEMLGLAGPFVKSEKVLGGWTVGNDGTGISLLEGIECRWKENPLKTAMTEELLPMQLGFFDVKDETDTACKVLKDCDTVVLAVGEHEDDTGEGASKTNLRLSVNQEKLIWKMKEQGKKVIVVVFSGRPLELKPILDWTDAVVQAWFPGTESGNAIAELLMGGYNPSGRLCMSFPQTVGQCPVYYNTYRSGRPKGQEKNRYTSGYLDCPNEPLFPFGYGLSYSDFIYKDFQIKEGENFQAEVTIKNISNRKGKETVQLYIRDCAASVVRPIKELKDFCQVELQPGEEKRIRFVITREKLKFWNAELAYVFEPGMFEIMVGRNSADVLTKTISVS